MIHIDTCPLDEIISQANKWKQAWDLDMLLYTQETASQHASRTLRLSVLSRVAGSFLIIRALGFFIYTLRNQLSQLRNAGVPDKCVVATDAENLTPTARHQGDEGTESSTEVTFASYLLHDTRYPTQWKQTVCVY
jgi:hypothetical protein